MYVTIVCFNVRKIITTLIIKITQETHSSINTFFILEKTYFQFQKITNASTAKKFIKQ